MNELKIMEIDAAQSGMDEHKTSPTGPGASLS